jgi:hypothetical protein
VQPVHDQDDGTAPTTIAIPFSPEVLKRAGVYLPGTSPLAVCPMQICKDILFAKMTKSAKKRWSLSESKMKQGEYCKNLG